MRCLIRYFDMFAGIGGFRAGLTRAGGFQCVGHCEIDKYADASYRAIHDIEKEECYYPDAREIDPGGMPDFDLLCGGFPCQSYSMAGHRLGFADPRGALFFEIARLAEARRPSYLLLENVPGLLSHDQGRTFAAILSTLGDLGYHVEWSVLNSAAHGVPQSRRRVFFICYLDPRCAGKILPVFGTDAKALIQLVGGPQGSRIYDPAGVACTQTAGAGGKGGKTGLYLVDLSKGAPERTEIARCLTARYGQTSLSNHPRERSGVLLIKDPTKKGYKEAAPGDSVDLGYPGSKTRGGRVSKLAHDAASLQGASMSAEARAEDYAYIRGAGLCGHARASGHSIILHSPDTGRAPILSETCAVYGTVMGDVHIMGDTVVLCDEKISNETLDTLVLNGQKRSMIRNPDRDTLKPNRSAEKQEKPPKRKGMER